MSTQIIPTEPGRYYAFWACYNPDRRFTTVNNPIPIIGWSVDEDGCVKPIGIGGIMDGDQINTVVIYDSVADIVVQNGAHETVTDGEMYTAVHRLLGSPPSPGERIPLDFDEYPDWEGV